MIINFQTRIQNFIPLAAPATPKRRLGGLPLWRSGQSAFCNLQSTVEPATKIIPGTPCGPQAGYISSHTTREQPQKR
jgi:hypothetical protein